MLVRSRIVVAARRETIESDSMHMGVLTACARPWVTPVYVSLLVYDDKGDGFRKVSELVKSGETDIIRFFDFTTGELLNFFPYIEDVSGLGRAGIWIDDQSPLTVYILERGSDTVRQWRIILK